jgi:hypothetical protein
VSATHPDAFALHVARPHRSSDLAAALRSTTPRRRLQLALGLIWLIDAALQYQPYMFGRTFVTQTIEPVDAGAPWIVAHPSLWAAHLMIHHIALYNTFFATIQLVLALAIFYRPLVKFGLGLSVVWGLGIWWLAEGIGGIFNNASPLTGAPGAVILYVVIALCVWPRRDDDLQERTVAERGALGSTIPKLLWGVLWIGLALLELERTNRSPSATQATIVAAEAGEPSWIASIERALAVPAAHHGTEISIVLAALFAITAIGVFDRRTAKVAVILAVLVAVPIWVIEDFGAIATGSGTDVNSGPLLVLLAACFWPLATAQQAGPPHAGLPSTG